MASLPSLPIELIDEIQDYLSDQDVLALRSICRSLDNKCFRQFGNRFFSTRSLHLFKTHLERLVAISRSRFARCVVKLVILFQEMVIIDIFDEPATNTIVALNGPRNVPDELAEPERKFYDSMVEERKQMIETGLHRILLDEAVSNLTSLAAVELDEWYKREENYKGCIPFHLFNYASLTLDHMRRGSRHGYGFPVLSDRIAERAASHPVNLLLSTLNSVGNNVEDIVIRFMIYGPYIFTSLAVQHSFLRALLPEVRELYLDCPPRDARTNH